MCGAIAGVHGDALENNLTHLDDTAFEVVDAPIRGTVALASLALRLDRASRSGAVDSLDPHVVDSGPYGKNRDVELRQPGTRGPV